MKENLCCIVYLSTAYELPTEASLEAILTDARNTNKEMGVTGVLLHHEGAFFQYIEGECGLGKGLDVIYEKIKESSQHFGIVQLLKMPINERLFDGWLMGSTRVSEDTMLSLKSANWQMLAEELQQHQNQLHPGLLLLKSQWSMAISRE